MADIKGSQIPVSENTQPGDMLMGVRKTAGGNTNFNLRVNALLAATNGAFMGLAEANTNPGVPASARYFQGKPGITYTYFKDASNTPITIPSKVGTQYVVDVRLIWQNTYWVATWGLMEILDFQNFGERIKLAVGGPLDSWEGPYDSIAAAWDEIPNEVDGEGVNFRLGKKPLIRIDGKLVQYWWPEGKYSNEDLVEVLKGLTKSEDLSRSVSTVLTGGTYTFLNLDLIQNFGISYATGEVVSSTFADVSKYIGVEGCSAITIGGRIDSQRGLVFLDRLGTKIKPVGETQFATTTANGDFPVPQGAVSCRIAVSNGLDLTVTTVPARSQGKAKTIGGLSVGDVYAEDLEGLASATAKVVAKLDDYANNTGIDYATGNILTANGIRVSPFISCKGFKTITIENKPENNSARGLVFFDLNGGKLKPVAQPQFATVGYNGTWGIPAGAVYFKIANTTTNTTLAITLNSQSNAQNLKLEKVNGITIPEQIIPKVSSLSAKVITPFSDYTEDVSIDYATGNLVQYLGGNRVSPPIQCEGFDTLTIVGRTENNAARGLVFFDINGGKLKAVNESQFATTGYNGTWTIPVGAVNFRITNRKDNTTLSLRLNSEALTKDLEIESINGIRVNGTSMLAPENPANYCNSGSGSEADPFKSALLNAGFSQALTKLAVRGGKIRVPNARFDFDAPFIVNRKNVHIEGDIWNYSNDPNGVWESGNGSKIKLGSKEFSGIVLTGSSNLSGGRIAQIGVQGIVSDSNTKGLFSVANAAKHAAVSMPSARVDQFEIYRLNACGLSAGLSVTGGGVDACILEKINADGCNVGIYYAPDVTYYTKLRDSILADCPAWGLWIRQSPTKGALSTMIISGLVLVRNCGGITEAQLQEGEAAGALIQDVSFFTIEDNQINDSGRWTEYFTTPGAVTVHTVVAAALIFKGYYSELRQNQVNEATGHSLILRGDRNKVKDNRLIANLSAKIEGSSNIFDSNSITARTSDYALEVTGHNNIIRNIDVNKKIRITGNANKLSSCFPTPGTTLPILVVIEAGATGTVLEGFQPAEVEDNGAATIFR